MAGELTVAVADVAAVRVIDQVNGQMTSGASITAGCLVKQNASTGLWDLADASTAALSDGTGLCIQQQGLALTVAFIGEVNLGAAMDALDYGDPVYLSDTAGKIASSAGSVTKLIGRVIGAQGGEAMERLLHLNTIGG